MTKVLRKFFYSKLFLSTTHLLSYCFTSLSALAQPENDEGNGKNNYQKDTQAYEPRNNEGKEKNNYQKDTQAYESKYDEQDLIKELICLAQHEIDMRALLNQAIKNIDKKNRKTKEKLSDLERKSMSNTQDLQKLIREYHGTPPSSETAKGFFKEVWTKIPSIKGDKGILRDLSENFKTMRDVYGSFLSLEFPKEVQEEIKKLYKKTDEELKVVEEEERNMA